MPSIEDSYSFSDEFKNFLQLAAANDPTAQEEESSTEDAAEPKEEEDNTDWEEKYNSLQAENESLRQQLKTLPDLANPDVQNDDFLSNYYNENEGKTGLLNMILNDDTDNENLNVKSNKVNLANVDMTLTGYVNSLTQKFGNKVLVTSGNDQKHAPNSRHYKGEALDLRYSPEVHKYIANDPIAKELGINVLPPNHGTAPHTHIQRKQYGGKYNL